MSTGDEPEVKAEVSSQQVRRQAIFALPTLEVDGNLVTDSGVPIRYIATIANPVPGVKGLYRHIYAVYGGEALKLVNSIDVQVSMFTLSFCIPYSSQGKGKSVKNPNNKPLLMAILATLKEANNDGIVIRCNCPASVLEAIKKKNKKATKRSKFSEEIEDIHVKMSSMTVFNLITP